MVSSEVLFSNLLAVSVLLILAIIIYCKITKRTLVELIRDFREAFSDKTEEAVTYVPSTFQDIR